MVPAEAKAVVRMELTKDDHCAAFAKNLVTQLGVTPEGLDLGSPLYAFITPNEYIGITAAVDDAGKLRQSMDQLVKKGAATACDDSDDLHWTWINKGWLVGWNSRSLLVLGPGVAQERDQLRQTIVGMMNGGESFSKTKNFERLLAQDGIVQIYSRLDAMPAPYNTLLRMDIPADTPLEAVQLFAGIKVEKEQEQVTMSGQLESDNADVLAAIDEFQKNKGGIYAGKGNNKIGHTPVLDLFTTTHGKDFLALLQGDATLRALLMGLNQVIDADRMLGTADGMLHLEVSTLDKDWNPTFRLEADNKTRGLLDDSDYWMESARKQKNVTLSRLTPNKFQLTNDGRQLQLGTIGHNTRVFFCTPGMDEFSSFGCFKQHSVDGSPKMLSYIDVSMKQLKTMPCMAVGSTARTFVDFVLPKVNKISVLSYPGRTIRLIFDIQYD